MAIALPAPVTKRARPRASAWIVPLCSFALFLLLWEAAALSGRMNPITFTGPPKVAAALTAMVRSGELWVHLAASARTFLWGYLSAVVLGAGVGLLVGSSRGLTRTFSPYVMALNAAPRVAFITVLLVWFGIGEFSRSLLVFLGVFFPVCVNSMAGARAADAPLINAARVFGANGREIFWKVIVPAAIPYIFTGMELGVGRGLVGLFLAESYGAQEGIGFVITQAAYLFRVDRLFGGLAVLAILSVLLAAAIRTLGERLTPWFEGGG